MSIGMILEIDSYIFEMHKTKNNVSTHNTQPMQSIMKHLQIVNNK